MPLDTTRKDTPYLLGRLMACHMEAAEKNRINRTDALMAVVTKETPAEQLKRFNRMFITFGNAYKEMGVLDMVQKIANEIEGDIKLVRMSATEFDSWFWGFNHQYLALQEK